MGVVLVVQFLGNKTAPPFDLSCASGQRLLGPRPLLCCPFAVSAATPPQFCAASVSSSLGSQWEAWGFRAQPLTQIG